MVHITILCIILFSIFLLIAQSKDLFQKSPAFIAPRKTILSPTPTPITLHSGKGEYLVSQSAHTGPRVSRVMFDPLDAQKGQTLIISVTTSSPVDSLTGVLATDNSELVLQFQKTSPFKKQEQWEARVKLTDTVWYQYVLSLTVKAHNQETMVQVAPRSR